jgi:hypothetical protein
MITPDAILFLCNEFKKGSKTVEVFGNDSNKSKFDSRGNQEEIEFW